MTCYIVAFQAKTKETREKIKGVLGSYPGYCPIHDYCWAISTEKKALEIRDEVQAVLDANDRVFVIRSGTEGAWFNSYDEVNDNWLKENL